MLRYAKYAVPLILKSSADRPARNLAERFTSIFLLFLGLVFLCVAALIWLSRVFGADIAFFGMGGLLIFTAGTMKLYFIWNRRRGKTSIPVAIEHDPLAGLIPDSVKQNPLVEKLLVQIAATPIAATVSAVSIGMLISRELLDDNHD